MASNAEDPERIRSERDMYAQHYERVHKERNAARQELEAAKEEIKTLKAEDASNKAEMERQQAQIQQQQEQIRQLQARLSNAQKAATTRQNPEQEKEHADRLKEEAEKHKANVEQIEASWKAELAGLRTEITNLRRKEAKTTHDLHENDRKRLRAAAPSPDSPEQPKKFPNLGPSMLRPKDPSPATRRKLPMTKPVQRASGGCKPTQFSGGFFRDERDDDEDGEVKEEVYSDSMFLD